jgi:PhoPQ-activated pathogenicity-related protein
MKEEKCCVLPDDLKHSLMTKKMVMMMMMMIMMIKTCVFSMKRINTAMLMVLITMMCTFSLDCGLNRMTCKILKKTCDDTSKKTQMAITTTTAPITARKKTKTIYAGIKTSRKEDRTQS